MRNLKRVLSLALALVMVLGMMVITTSAADFGDADEITYNEAVDVISAIGVITGDNGNFYPNRVLTREEGAALICYLVMGKEAADKLTGSGNFADVKADRWSAGEIDYCANLGYIKGYTDADGKQVFNPKGELTAVAYGRMLLGALGYDGNVEGYVGGNWATNIAADMIDAKLDVKGVAMDAQLTREQAAQMTLQAMQAATVEYKNGKGTDITFADGTSVSIGASEATKVAGTDEDDDPYVELMEKLELGLTKSKVTADLNGGLAGYKWTLEGVTLPIGVYATESVKASYPAGTKLVDIVKALGVQDTTSTTVTKYDVEVYRNGVWTKGVYSVDADDYFVDVTDVSGAALYDYAEAFGTIPNGCSVDVVVTKDAAKQPVIRLLTNISYLGTITKNDVTKDEVVDDEDTRAVTITSSNGVVYTLNAKNCKSFEDIFAAASALKKPTDKLTYVIVPEGDPAADEEGGKLLSIAAPEAVTGTMTSYNTTKGTYVIDGETYKLNATATGFTMTDMIGEEATYLLDANGFVLFASLVEEKADDVYAYLRTLAYVTVANDGSIGSQDKAYLQAELVFTDGTVKIVEVATLIDDAKTSYAVDYDGETKYLKTKAVNATTWTDEGDTYDSTFEAGFDGEFVAYTIDEDGLYTLASAVNFSTGEVADVAADVVFTAGKAANTKTVFVVETENPTTHKPVYTAYTGYANLPAKSIDKAEIVGMTDKGVATVVYVKVTDAADGSSADGKTVAYITGDATFFYVDGKTKDYYEYTAVIDGAATTIKVAADDVVAKGNLYTIETVDANGYVSDADVVAFTDVICTAAANDIVNISNAWKSYDENTVVYVIDKFGAVKTVDITALEVGANALYVTYVKSKVVPTDDTNVIKEIIAVPAAKLAPAAADTSAAWYVDSVNRAPATYWFTKVTFANDTVLAPGAMTVVLKDEAGAVVAKTSNVQTLVRAEGATVDAPFFEGYHEPDNWTAGHMNLGEGFAAEVAEVEVYVYGVLVDTIDATDPIVID